MIKTIMETAILCGLILVASCVKCPKTKPEQYAIFIHGDGRITVNQQTVPRDQLLHYLKRNGATNDSNISLQGEGDWDTLHDSESAYTIYMINVINELGAAGYSAFKDSSEKQ